jgi:hypothetical protein
VTKLPILINIIITANWMVLFNHHFQQSVCVARSISAVAGVKI